MMPQGFHLSLHVVGKLQQITDVTDPAKNQSILFSWYLTSLGKTILAKILTGTIGRSIYRQNIGSSTWLLVILGVMAFHLSLCAARIVLQVTLTSTFTSSIPFKITRHWSFLTNKPGERKNLTSSPSLTRIGIVGFNFRLTLYGSLHSVIVREEGVTWEEKLAD